MSVIQSIRDKYAALVIALIALSLVAFILMDAFVGGGKGSAPGTTVGKVNGEKIERNAFERQISMQQQMYGAQAQREQLIGNVWTMQVDELLMNQEYEKLGLQFSTKELNDVLFGANPPQWLQQEFTDQQTGAFNVNAAKQYFAQMKKQKDNPNLEMFTEAYIKPTISQTLRSKYMALLTQSAYVPKWLAEKTVADQSAATSFSYAMVPYTSISDSAITVSDDDIKNYMKAHESEFQQEEESRSISYVSFDAYPNSEDSAKTLNAITALQNDFATATDPAAYLSRVSSETPYLDGYILGSKLQVPNADAIKALANGQTFGPYLDATNYTIAKMIDRRVLADSVKVRHILIKTGERGQPTLADSIAKSRIDSIAAAAQSGADFNALVIKYSDDQGSKSTKGEYEFASAQFSNLSKEFAEVAFYGKVGDKKIVKVDNQSYSGYHYIEVLEQRKPELAYKVAYLSRSIDASQETINTASNAAAQFAGNSRNRKSFDENVQKQNKQALIAADIKRNDNTATGLGDSRQLIRWVYDNEVGDVSEPFEVGDRYIVALITDASDKGLMSIGKGRMIAEPFVRNEKKAQQIINNKFKGGASLEAVAQGAGVSVMRADSVSFAQPFIPNIGNEPKITGAAFNKSLVGKVSDPIAGNTGVFAIRAENAFGMVTPGNTSEQVRQQLEGQLKQMGGYRSIEALKKAAKIEDNRYEFY